MTIKALIEADKKVKESGVGADFYRRHYEFAKAARNALPEIVELVELAKKGADLKLTFGDVDRIREICDE